jgi:UDPglucose--hexose-1-phosphate uridylyltransferase
MMNDDLNQPAAVRIQHFSLQGLPMPELRKDPIVGRWVIIATDRAKRPVVPKTEAPPTSTGLCPFCEGQEDKTPHEIIAYRDRNTRSNERGWRVRVVPNKSSSSARSMK